MVVAVAGFAVDGAVVADAEEGDDGDEEGDDEEEERSVLNGGRRTLW